MKHIPFELSMPNNSSWNGKWSQADNPHCKVRIYPFRKNSLALSPSLTNILSTDGCYYDFGDGWGARVSIRKCSATEKTKITKSSQGFCGYDWMIDEIEQYGRILDREERQEVESRTNP